MAEPLDYYCSEKFTWLSVDLEKRQSFSCCAATPHKIDLEWVKQNPGQLFNTPELQQERQDMLNNVPVASCEGPCWQSERNNLLSRRMLLDSTKKTHTNIKVDSPEQLHVMLGSTCNLTCSYCCKQYSSAWLRDINEHGPYLNRDRFTINKLDKILIKVGHKDHQLSDGFQNLIDEIATFGQTQRIFITGGEPLLYNNFPNLLNSLTDAKSIVFFTGLGVDPTRFSTQLKKITNKKNLQVVVSAENCEKFYEFNRYGNSWNNFLLNLEELKKQQFSFHFSTVLSNLTLFGLVEFVNKFSDYTFQHEFCGDPDFLNVNVLDKTSKQLLTAQLESSNILFKDELISALNQPCTPNQRQDLSTYITKFVAHRTLSLDIFPKHFCKWLQDVD